MKADGAERQAMAKTAAQLREALESMPELATELRAMLHPPHQAQIAVSISVTMLMQIIEELEGIKNGNGP